MGEDVRADDGAPFQWSLEEGKIDKAQIRSDMVVAAHENEGDRFQTTPRRQRDRVVGTASTSEGTFMWVVGQRSDKSTDCRC